MLTRRELIVSHPLFDISGSNHVCGWFVRVEDGLLVGGESGGATPGPVPNPEAKSSSADGTALDRVWESRTPPTIQPVEKRGEGASQEWFSSPHPSFFIPKIGV